MKYDKEHIDKILEGLSNGDGRVRSCKAAGISYDTFLAWMNKKVEFAEAVKKAEVVGEDKIKDLAKRGIIEKFMTQWQAAAWWLERNYPEEFKIRTEITERDDRFAGWTKEELQEYARTGKRPDRRPATG